MMCPKCGQIEVDRVIVFAPTFRSLYGLGFACSVNGEICCSFKEDQFSTFEEAQKEIDSTSFVVR